MTQQTGGFIMKSYFQISNIAACKQKMFPIIHCQMTDFQPCFTVPRQTFFTGFPIKIKKTCIFNWISVESLKTINKLCTLHLPWKPVISPYPVTMVKSHKKKCLNYFRMATSCYLQYGEMLPECQLWRDWYCAFNRKKWWVLTTVKNV